MSIVKILSLVFLSIFLIFTGLIDFMGFQIHSIGNLILGLFALGSGILMLLSIREFYHYSDNEGQDENRKF